jgi:hypothetical protein
MSWRVVSLQEPIERRQVRCDQLLPAIGRLLQLTTGRIDDPEGEFSLNVPRGSAARDASARARFALDAASSRTARR